MCSAVHVVPDGAISLFHLSPSSYTKSSSINNSSSSLNRRSTDGDKAGADIESLKKQLLIVDQRLATLTGRLEVLKAVQQVLPAGKPLLWYQKNKLFLKFLNDTERTCLNSLLVISWLSFRIVNKSLHMTLFLYGWKEIRFPEKCIKQSLWCVTVENFTSFNIYSTRIINSSITHMFESVSWLPSSLYTISPKLFPY